MSILFQAHIHMLLTSRNMWQYLNSDVKQKMHRIYRKPFDKLCRLNAQKQAKITGVVAQFQPIKPNQSTIHLIKIVTFLNSCVYTSFIEYSRRVYRLSQCDRRMFLLCCQSHFLSLITYNNAPHFTKCIFMLICSVP